MTDVAEGVLVSAHQDHTLEVAFGAGWTAEICSTGTAGYLYVSPDGDPLPLAIDALISAAIQPFISVEWVGNDPQGWDVYRLAYDASLATV